MLWFLLACIWAATFPAIKIGIQTMQPMTLVAHRMIIAALVLLAFIVYKRIPLHTSISIWLHGIAIGLTGNVIPFFLISWGETTVDSSVAAVLMGLTPIVTVFLASLLFADEPLTGRKVAGLSLGISGLLILVGVGVFSEAGQHVPGLLAIAMAAVFYALNTLYVRKFVHQGGIMLAFVACLAGALITSPVAIAVDKEHFFQMPSLSALLALLYLGVIATALATFVYLYLIPKIGAGRMSQINFLIPVLGAFFGVVLLNETLDANLIIALITVIGAVYLVNREKG